ncbi:probable 39S ribosomal protein L24, mitochondrial [Paramacrobiotus metropolitanus]|uniref:probable 39S ribosomal protein L24, mitochondrial n=1 Tax=Paramacrobiotus metropolitanus TaxID=2943436 RepID=UPI002445EA12|nr:probable 39S ribosomal protein L24, mitochondrial [Paramacrobiotus metropolitanus]
MRLSIARLCYHRNFPKGYLKKEKGIKQDPKWERSTYRYTEERFWSNSEKNLNHPSSRIADRDRLVHAPLKNWCIYRGDLVQILAGKDKGKRAEVVQVVRERNWCFVRGKNLKYEEVGKAAGVPARIVGKEMPLDVVHEVALIDPTDNTATQVEWRYTEEGDKVRVSKRTGRIIPLPVQAEETYEYKTRSSYKENPKDTDDKTLKEVTFTPAPRTFEEDIMQAMGIVDTRKPPRTFWY